MTGGKGRAEEWVEIIKMDGQGACETVIESEGTKHAYKQQPECGKHVLRETRSESQPIKRAKLASS